ncbi:MAG: DUF452 family protein [Flavobacteriaceae bacterium]|nr:DUF452 family protein [Flavobacteriaceae bacterium]
MKITWLNKDGNNDCILFFNGWGMDACVINHLETKGYDVCMLNDYKAIDSLKIEVSGYSKVYVVAWSLGVWAASCILDSLDLNITKAIAINGTQMPVDLSCGIPPSVFENTYANWGETNRNRFNRRVLGGKVAFELDQHKLASRDIEEQQVELGIILGLVKEKKNINFCFDTALIGQDDLIFSPTNQWRFWKRKAMVVELKLPHYPFNYFKNWQQIISM